ncbi:extracellular solute-binding protein [Loktanella sp. IMCC34160]|uniref:ABC transporter substrate-binding protein n=1 Tax=Loktanella sp. IMCC34160 TaxID=2510646 RepID=UPI00101D76F4|nr:extracellular solute-binding protein [Loktanella sp. IMCC34160]RYG91770.1 extracellular solute-binding protein [Loktanella sp. IMCC34160]
MTTNNIREAGMSRENWNIGKAAAMAGGLSALALASAATAGEIELFQTKAEAHNTYVALIAEFEAAHPDITVNLVEMPDAGTVLRTRMVRGDLPDIIATDGNNTFADLADAGVLLEVSDTGLASAVQPAYLDMIARLTEVEGNYGLPYTANANTVLYNKEIFEANGWSTPTTWDEFIAVAEASRAAGITPFYHTYLDSWTLMVPWNSLASNIQSADFAAARASGDTTFAEQYPDVADKMLQLLALGHEDNFGAGYDDGNRAFANGESAMLVQGVWAIPAVQSNNPEINIGAFAMPVLNDASQNKLISGVDTLFAISAESDNIDDSKAFIAFMQQPEIATRFINEQKQFSTLNGVFQSDPIFDELKPYFESGRITSFADHYYEAGMNVSTLIQEFLLNGDKEAFLQKLDSEWDAVAQR